MKKSTTLIAIAMAWAAVADGPLGKEFHIPTDPGAIYSYKLLDDADGRTFVLSRRTPSSNNSWDEPRYTIIEWDCDADTYRYRANHRSADQAFLQFEKGYGENDEMIPMLRNSIKWHQFPFHCGLGG